MIEFDTLGDFYFFIIQISREVLRILVHNVFEIFLLSACLVVQIKKIEIETNIIFSVQTFLQLYINVTNNMILDS